MYSKNTYLTNLRQNKYNKKEQKIKQDKYKLIDTLHLFLYIYMFIYYIIIYNRNII